MVGCEDSGRDSLCLEICKSGRYLFVRISNFFYCFVLLTTVMDNKLRNFFFHNGNDIHIVNNMGMNRIAKEAASKNGEIDEIRNLVKLGVNINTPDYNGITPITHAVRGNNERIAIYLASLNANGYEAYKKMPILKESRTIPDIDHLSKNDDTLLIRASLLNKTDKIRSLLQEGAYLEAKTKNGSTALIKSSEQGKTESVKYLLRVGADITAKTNIKTKIVSFRRQISGGFNSLMMACSNGHVKTANILISAGMYVNDRSANGFTPLMIAVAHGHKDMVTFLLNKGSSIKDTDMDGITAYMYSSPLKDSTIGKMLISHVSTENSQIFDNTFSEENMSLISLTDRDTPVGGCYHIDNIRLPDGRCVHMTTREARQTMMHLLEIPVRLKLDMKLPIQVSGTCWFFSSIVAMFVSDLAIKNTIFIRKKMIAGTKSNISVNIVLLRLNMMIQNIVDGLSTVKNVMLPITSNEKIVIGLRENKIHRVSHLNSGSDPIRFIRNLLKYMDPVPKSLFKKTRSEYIGYDLKDSIDRNSPALFYFIEIDKNTRMKTELSLSTKMGSHKYIADSVTMRSKYHAISGITINNEYFVSDSNSGYPVRLNWMQNLQNGLTIDYRDSVYGGEFFITAVFYQLI